jgi:hypothetical protein
MAPRKINRNKLLIGKLAFASLIALGHSKNTFATSRNVFDKSHCAIEVLKLDADSSFEKIGKRKFRTLFLNNEIPKSEHLSEFIKKIDPTSYKPLELTCFDSHFAKQDLQAAQVIRDTKQVSNFDIYIFLGSLPNFDNSEEPQNGNRQAKFNFEKASRLLDVLAEIPEHIIGNRKIALHLTFHGNRLLKRKKRSSCHYPFQDIQENPKALAVFLQKMLWFKGILKLNTFWILPFQEKMVQIFFETPPLSQPESPELEAIAYGLSPKQPCNCDELFSNILIELGSQRSQRLLGTYYLKNITFMHSLLDNDHTNEFFCLLPSSYDNDKSPSHQSIDEKIIDSLEDCPVDEKDITQPVEYSEMDLKFMRDLQ